eukprot:scaffold16871_cov118-Isochrysis_galbana.AAC.5
MHAVQCAVADRGGVVAGPGGAVSRAVLRASCFSAHIVGHWIHFAIAQSARRRRRPGTRAGRGPRGACRGGGGRRRNGNTSHPGGRAVFGWAHSEGICACRRAKHHHSPILDRRVLLRNQLFAVNGRAEA